MQTPGKSPAKRGKASDAGASHSPVPTAAAATTRSKGKDAGRRKRASGSAGKGSGRKKGKGGGDGDGDYEPDESSSSSSGGDDGDGDTGEGEEEEGEEDEPSSGDSEQQDEEGDAGDTESEGEGQNDGQQGGRVTQSSSKAAAKNAGKGAKGSRKDAKAPAQRTPRQQRRQQPQAHDSSPVRTRAAAAAAAETGERPRRAAASSRKQPAKSPESEEHDSQDAGKARGGGAGPSSRRPKRTTARKVNYRDLDGDEPSDSEPDSSEPSGGEGPAAEAPQLEPAPEPPTQPAPEPSPGPAHSQHHANLLAHKARRAGGTSASADAALARAAALAPCSSAQRSPAGSGKASNRAADAVEPDAGTQLLSPAKRRAVEDSDGGSGGEDAGAVERTPSKRSRRIVLDDDDCDTVMAPVAAGATRAENPAAPAQHQPQQQQQDGSAADTAMAVDGPPVAGPSSDQPVQTAAGPVDLPVEPEEALAAAAVAVAGTSGEPAGTAEPPQLLPAGPSIAEPPAAAPNLLAAEPSGGGSAGIAAQAAPLAEPQDTTMVPVYADTAAAVTAEPPGLTAGAQADVVQEADVAMAGVDTDIDAVPAATAQHDHRSHDNDAQGAEQLATAKAGTADQPEWQAQAAVRGEEADHWDIGDGDPEDKDEDKGWLEVDATDAGRGRDHVGQMGGGDVPGEGHGFGGGGGGGGGSESEGDFEEEEPQHAGPGAVGHPGSGGDGSDTSNGGFSDMDGRLGGEAVGNSADEEQGEGEEGEDEDSYDKSFIDDEQFEDHGKIEEEKADLPKAFGVVHKKSEKQMFHLFFLYALGKAAGVADDGGTLLCQRPDCMKGYSHFKDWQNGARERIFQAHWVRIANESGLKKNVQTYPGLMLGELAVNRYDESQAELRAGPSARRTPDNDRVFVKKQTGGGKGTWRRELKDNLRLHEYWSNADKETGEPRCCICNTQRHMLYPVSLTRTPAGARAGSRESEMVVYVAGGRCARRLKMLYAALYFQDRLEAAIRREVRIHLARGLGTEAARRLVLEGDLRQRSYKLLKHLKRIEYEINKNDGEWTLDDPYVRMINKAWRDFRALHPDVEQREEPLPGVPEVHSEHDEANADSASSDEGESSDASHSANHNAAQSTSDTGTSSTSGDDDIQAVNDGEGPEVGTVVRRTRQGTRAHADQANQATNAGGARPSGRSAAERAADAAAAPLRTPQRLRPNATPSNAGAGGNEPATGVEVVALEDSD